MLFFLSLFNNLLKILYLFISFNFFSSIVLFFFGRLVGLFNLFLTLYFLVFKWNVFEKSSFKFVVIVFSSSEVFKLFEKSSSKILLFKYWNLIGFSFLKIFWYLFSGEKLSTSLFLLNKFVLLWKFDNFFFWTEKLWYKEFSFNDLDKNDFETCLSGTKIWVSIGDFSIIWW